MNFWMRRVGLIAPSLPLHEPCFRSMLCHQRHLFNIYRQILEMHLYKQYLFKPQTVAAYSEQDFIVKFWSYAFEEVFSATVACACTGILTRKKQTKEAMKMKTALPFNEYEAV
ncbi:hypothetical protein BDF20DRAFT_898370 [Mycotypha africana]|uniref:uncharacterized protein n=1 Tax=Mycotypha africana TaxID=64632 RepID=UPI0022FFDA8E|nr:uncharacterized protein BDF20DRAFT_898370 [Mycotypha africana]KAI8968012.1 hypothetical protein BDF20DRAFT_898370 [Mycotypha africana]